MERSELLEVIDTLRLVGGDTAAVEAKRARKALPTRLWETLSAFSNTRGGGLIVLGLDEEEGFAVTGVADAAKIASDLGSLCGNMEPPVRAVIQTHEVEGHLLVTAEVPEVSTANKPCFYKGAGLTNGAFIRVADGDRKLTGYEVQLLLSGRGQPRDDLRAVEEASPTDLDADLVSGLVGRLRRARPRVFATASDEEVLRRVRALVLHGGRSVPTVAGLLALGAYPQEFLPQANLTFVVYPGLRAGQTGPGGERFLDNLAVDGPVPEMIQVAYAAFQRNMRRRSIITGLGRQDVWEYPETALREALVNALAHRDLSSASLGTPVQVEMYPDRLVIRNPGGLYGPVGVDDLGVEHISSTRNEVLLRLLEETPLPGTDRTVAENRGSGIPTMVAALREAGMDPPIFHDRIATFQVTFPNHSLLDDDIVDWLRGIGAGDLSNTQLLGLARMRRGEVLSNGSFRSGTGLDSRVAGAELRDLVDRGLVHQTGTRGAARYTLSVRAEEGLPSEGGHETVGAGPIPAEQGDALAPRSRRRSAAERHAQIRKALQEGPRSRQELEALLSLQPASVLRHLRSMHAAGEVEQTGSARSPKGRWRLITTSATPPTPTSASRNAPLPP